MRRTTPMPYKSNHENLTRCNPENVVVMQVLWHLHDHVRHVQLLVFLRIMRQDIRQIRAEHVIQSPSDGASHIPFPFVAKWKLHLALIFE